MARVSLDWSAAPQRPITVNSQLFAPSRRRDNAATQLAGGQRPGHSILSGLLCLKLRGIFPGKVIDTARCLVGGQSDSHASLTTKPVAQASNSTPYLTPCYSLPRYGPPDMAHHPALASQAPQALLLADATGNMPISHDNPHPHPRLQTRASLSPPCRTCPTIRRARRVAGRISEAATAQDSGALLWTHFPPALATPSQWT